MRIDELLSPSTQSWLPLTDAVAKATLVLAVAALSSFFLRRASAATRHSVWALGLAGALVLPALSIALPRWQVPVITIQSPGAPAALPATDVKVVSAPPLERPTARGVGQKVDETATVPGTPAPPIEAPAPRLSITWPLALFIVWVAGAAIVFGRLALGLVAVLFLSRRTQRVADAPWLPLARQLATEIGITRRVSFLRSRSATMPMAWGIFRSAVLMPAEADSWPAERLRVVLLHELAHVKRRDCLTHVVGQMTCALYWFNPLAWIAARHVRMERERACDDLVLAAGTRGSEYATQLLEIARAMRAGRFPAVLAGATLAMAHRSQLEGRLMAILDTNIRRSEAGRARTAACAALLAVGLLPLAAVQPWAYAAVTTESPMNPHAPQSAAAPPVPTAAQPIELSTAAAQTRSGGVQGGVTSGVAQSVARGVAAGNAGGVHDGIVGGIVEQAFEAAVEAIGQNPNPNPNPQPNPNPNPNPNFGWTARGGEWQPRGERKPADPRVVAALTAALKDTDKGVRESAMHALIQMRDPGIFEPLMQALTDASPDVRQQAAHGLGQMRDKRAVTPLIGALKDKDADVRQQAAFALGQLRDPAAVPELMATLRDADKEVRQQAVFALSQLRDPRAVEPLISALKDSDPEVRQQAAFAVGQLRDVRAVDALIVALKDENAEVRQQAAFALGQLRDMRAIDGLTAALKDANAEVRQQAAFALGQIAR